MHTLRNVYTRYTLFCHIYQRRYFNVSLLILQNSRPPWRTTVSSKLERKPHYIYALNVRMAVLKVNNEDIRIFTFSCIMLPNC